MADEILPQIVALRLKDKDQKLALVDIRPEEERKICSIPGDIHVPAEKFDASKFEGKEIIVYCKTGIRSAMLAEEWQEKGFNIKNLAGGIHAWSDKVDPSIPKYGH